MGVKERMRMCQLIEKIDDHKVYSQKLGLENKSSFCGNKIIRMERKNEVNKS